jgi:aryl-alcohol dehydrogenase-like predicted oxidoreductase
METNSPQVQLRTLGRTDIKITPIGLGVMQFAGGKGVFTAMFPHIPQAEKNEIVKAAINSGINWFDTAELYGRGRSEEALSTALKAGGFSDQDVLIATKWNPFLRKARSIPRTIHDRLRYLDGYTIDLHQIHQPVSFSTPEEEMDAMADLVEAGLIRSVGVSNFSAERMRAAHTALAKRGLPLASNQVQYSLVHRHIESNGILETAKELGITIICWSPLGSGLLTGKFHKDPNVFKNAPIGRRFQMRRGLEGSRDLIPVLDEIAEKYNATAAQVALNWLINFQGDTVVAIPGASKVKHAQESAGAMKFKLTEEEINRLDELSRQFK